MLLWTNLRLMSLSTITPYGPRECARWWRLRKYLEKRLARS